MATRISQYYGNLIANWLRGVAMPTAPVAVYAALSTATVTDTTDTVEPTGGYARQAVTFGTIANSEASGSIMSNSAPLVFTGLNACVVTDVALYDAATGGNLLAFTKLAVPVSVAAAGSLSFGVGVHTFQFAGLASYFFGNVVCNWLKGTTPATLGALSLAHSTTPVLRSGAGLNEPNGGYTRHVIAFGAPTFVSDVGTTIANTNNMIFGPATDPWSNITHAAVVSAAGNIITSGAVAVPFSVPIGSGRGVNAGAFKLLVR